MTFAGWLQIYSRFRARHCRGVAAWHLHGARVRRRAHLPQPLLAPVERGFYRARRRRSAARSRAGSATRSRCWSSMSPASCCSTAPAVPGSCRSIRRASRASRPTSPFNTAVSFVTNTNWQSYGGETTMSHLGQMAGLTVQNFLSAATGIALAVALVARLRALERDDGRQFLGRSDPRDALRAAAARRSSSRSLSWRSGCRRRSGLGRRDHARGRQADHRARPRRQPGGHQAARHQWRRLLQCQRRASVREPERLVELPLDLRHAR